MRNKSTTSKLKILSNSDQCYFRYSRNQWRSHIFLMWGRGFVDCVLSRNGVWDILKRFVVFYGLFTIVYFFRKVEVVYHRLFCFRMVVVMSLLKYLEGFL